MGLHCNFDRLARTYRAQEYLVFGRDLERARFAHLDRLRDCRSILVLGEGDGRCLARLVPTAPAAHVDCIELSPAMLARARKRIAGTSAARRVTFHQADVLTTVLPARHYDAVITHFFLDCFTPAQAEAVMARIQQSLRPGAWWLWADFVLPTGRCTRLRARAWLAILYAYFRWQTGHRARALPPVEPFFARHGCKALAESSFQLGMVRSVAWKFAPHGAVCRALDRPGPPGRSVGQAAAWPGTA